MSESPCAHCGYDLSATAFSGYERVCPECGGANVYATMPAPWWMRHPWRFDFLIATIGAPWAALALAFAWLSPGNSRPALPFVVVATLVLAVGCGIGWVVWLQVDIRRKFGRNFTSVWALVWHVLAALVGIPIVWALTLAAIDIARLYIIGVW